CRWCSSFCRAARSCFHLDRARIARQLGRGMDLPASSLTSTEVGAVQQAASRETPGWRALGLHGFTAGSARLALHKAQTPVRVLASILGPLGSVKKGRAWSKQSGAESFRKSETVELFSEAGT